MTCERSMEIQGLYRQFIDEKSFPCIAAKAALVQNQINIIVCDHIACPKDDRKILQFLYEFIDNYRSSSKMYHSTVVIFEGPTDCNEGEFDRMMWQRLQSISDLDATSYPWDHRVSNDPTDPGFSFSIKEEALYIIGLHPGSSRKARQFQFPALVFNPHDQFERLRSSEKYSTMKESVRKRDIALSGSFNPMLDDFGHSSEAFQYSGRVYDETWKCPFISNHEKDKYHSTS